MNYFVYENWGPDNKAKVHEGDCRYCHQGNGQHEVDEYDRKNSKWHGPFATLELAIRAARATERKNVALCKVCLRNREKIIV